MKNLLAIIVGLFLICAGIVTASDPDVKVLKVICPICEKEIKDNTYVAEVYKDGQYFKVHYYHAFDKAWDDRFASLKRRPQ